MILMIWPDTSVNLGLSLESLRGVIKVVLSSNLYNKVPSQAPWNLPLALGQRREPGVSIALLPLPKVRAGYSIGEYGKKDWMALACQMDHGFGPLGSVMSRLLCCPVAVGCRDLPRAR